MKYKIIKERFFTDMCYEVHEDAHRSLRHTLLDFFDENGQKPISQNTLEILLTKIKADFVDSVTYIPFGSKIAILEFDFEDDDENDYCEEYVWIIGPDGDFIKEEMPEEYASEYNEFLEEDW